MHTKQQFCPVAAQLQQNHLSEHVSSAQTHNALLPTDPWLMKWRHVPRSIKGRSPLPPPHTGLALLVSKTSGSHRSPCTILAEIHNIIIVVSRTDMVCLHLCYGLSTHAYINSKYLKKKHHLVSIPNGTLI